MRFHREHVLALGLAVGAVGCGWFGSSSNPEPEADTQDVKTVTVDPAPIQPDAPEQRLEFNVPVGTRFPLVKTVEQKLRQATPDGPIESRSLLRLQMAIVVDAVQPDQTKTLSVKYHRVRYEHDIGDDHLRYDSAVPAGGALPSSLQAYQGLVGNGFSFVIGADNKFRAIHDFKGFLERCLRNVPEHRRNAVLAELEATHGEEAIGNFIDDSIGILPYDPNRKGRESVVKVDQEWENKWQTARPIPMVTTMRYRLLRLDEQFAEVFVQGTIGPSSTFGPSDQPADTALVVVRGGTVSGHCSIRRDTGIPTRSRIARRFDMVVRMPDGTSFDQTKDVATTIETFQEQGSPHTVPAIVPASAQTPGGEPPVKVEHADFQAP